MSFKSTTTQRRSRLQHGYCIGISRRSAKATVSKGLGQGPYVASRAGVEPKTLRFRVIDLTSAPPRPTSLFLSKHSSPLGDRESRLNFSLRGFLVLCYSKPFLRTTFCVNSWPD